MAGILLQGWPLRAPPANGAPATSRHWHGPFSSFFHISLRHPRMFQPDLSTMHHRQPIGAVRSDVPHSASARASVARSSTLGARCAPLPLQHAARLLNLPFLVALAACLLLTFAATAAACQDTAVAPQLPVDFQPDALLMVIDHSGSMKEAVSKSDPGIRWSVVREKATETLRNLPLGTRVWILIFSDEDPLNPKTMAVPIVSQLNTERERQLLLDQLNNYAPPRGGTKLYDNVFRALEEAQRLATETPDRNVSLMVFTDGEDSGSRKKSHEVDALAGAARTANPRLYLIRKVVGPQGGDLGSSFEDRPLQATLSLRLAPAKVLLRNPRQTPQQNLTLNFRLSPQAQEKLRGQQATYTITAPPDGPQFPSGSFPIADGPVQIPLEVANANALSADQTYTAQLKINYPSLPGYDIDHGAASSVELSFLPGDRPQILQVRPADNAVYPVGAEVLFFVEALQDSTVVWDLGDGVQRTGREVRYRYETPGERSVTVTVSGTGGVAPAQRELKLQVLDVRLTVDPPPPAMFALQPQLLTVSTRGNVQNLKWLVDGQTYIGQPRADGQPGEQLAVTLAEGAHEVVVRGFASGLDRELYSPRVPLLVQQQPALSILSPQQDQELFFEDHLTFSALVTGPAGAVTWQIQDASGQQLLPDTETPVVDSPQGRLAVLSVPQIPEVRPEQALQVLATLKPMAGYQFGQIQQRVAAVVRFTPFRGQIGLPAKQPWPWRDQPAQLRLLTQSRIAGVRWSIPGTDLRSDQLNPAFTFPGTGSFTVNAEVTDMSNRTTVLSSSIQVLADPPQAALQVLSGATVPPLYYTGTPYQLDSSKSTGDILAREWKVNNAVQGTADGAITFKEPGSYLVELRVQGPVSWVAGTPGHPGPPASDIRTLTITVRPAPDLLAMMLTMLGTTLVLGLITWYFWGNSAVHWKLIWVLEAGAAESVELMPGKPLRARWSRLRKSAVFRFSELAPLLSMDAAGVEYWQRGPGAKQTVTITGRSATGASILFSSRGEPRTETRPDKRTQEFAGAKWIDRRCQALSASRWHFRVNHRKRGFLPDWLVLILGFSAIVAGWMIIWWWYCLR